MACNYLLGLYQPNQNQRSVVLTLTAHQPVTGATNDAVHWIYNKRIHASRRARHRQPELGEIQDDLCNIYKEQ